MKRLIRWVLLAVALAGTPALAQYDGGRVSIVTGGTGGLWYPLGGAIADQLSKSLPGLAATAEVTGGSVDNIRLLSAGKADMGFSAADAAWDAYHGQGKFKEKVALRVLAVFYPQKNHVVTLEGNGIKKMSDLRGRRVSIGPPGSASELIARRVLQAYGIDADKDIIKERLGVGEAVNALKDGKIDAFSHVAGVPIPAVIDLAATPRLKIRIIDHSELVPAINKRYGPLYMRGTLPANTYPGQTRDVATVEIWSLFVTTDQMSDQLAYNIVKTLFEKKAQLMLVNKDMSYMSYENQFTGASPIPFHPGALKYFAEKGMRPRQ